MFRKGYVGVNIAVCTKTVCMYTYENHVYTMVNGIVYGE